MPKIYGNLEIVGSTVVDANLNVTGIITGTLTGTASNVAGGTANSIVYQSSANNTTFLSPSTGVVYYNGSALVYSTAPTLIGTNFTSIPNSATTATSANTVSAIVARDISGNFSAGIITATLSGNATTATTATTATNANNVATTATSTNASFFPLFAASSTNSNQAINLDASGFTYNPSTNTLTASIFSGSLNGNATTSTSATNANNINTSVTSGGNQYYLFGGLSSSAGNQAPFVTANLYYDNALSSLWYNGGNYTSEETVTGTMYGFIAGNTNSASGDGAGISLRSGFPGSINYVVNIFQNIGSSTNNLLFELSRYNNPTTDDAYVINNDASGNINHIKLGTLKMTSNTNQIKLGGATTTTLTMASLSGNRTVTFPDADSNTIRPSSASANQFATGIASTGIISYAQPTFTNLSGSIANTQIPNSIVNFTPTIGDQSGNFFTTTTATGNYILLSSNLAFVWVTIAWTSKGSASGFLSLKMPGVTTSGLVPRYNFTIGFIDGINLSGAGVNNLQAFNSSGSNEINFSGLNSGGGFSFISVSNCNASGQLQLSGTILI